MAGSRWQQQAGDEPTEAGRASELEGFASEKSHFHSVDSLRNRRKRGRGSSDFGGVQCEAALGTGQGNLHGTGPLSATRLLHFKMSDLGDSSQQKDSAGSRESRGFRGGGGGREEHRRRPGAVSRFLRRRYVGPDSGGVKKAAFN